MSENKLVSFDVRSLLAAGTDPFKEIMLKVEALGDDETLEIINTFEPVPLINVLKSKGFIAEVIRKGELVYAYFKKDGNAKVEANEETTISENNFDEVYKSFIGKMEYVDVRQLEMPEPMTTILEKLEILPSGYCLLVDHKKVPQFLLPELKERGFEILYNEISANHLQLLIFKEK